MELIIDKWNATVIDNKTKVYLKISLDAFWPIYDKFDFSGINRAIKTFLLYIEISVADLSVELIQESYSSFISINTFFLSSIGLRW